MKKILIILMIIVTGCFGNNEEPFINDDNISKEETNENENKNGTENDNENEKKTQKETGVDNENGVYRCKVTSFSENAIRTEETSRVFFEEGLITRRVVALEMIVIDKSLGITSEEYIDLVYSEYGQLIGLVYDLYKDAGLICEKERINRDNRNIIRVDCDYTKFNPQKIIDKFPELCLEREINCKDGKLIDDGFFISIDNYILETVREGGACVRE